MPKITRGRSGLGPEHYSYAQVVHTRAVRSEDRLFCLSCRVSIAGGPEAEAVIGLHVATAHGLDPDAPGGWVRGRRYGAMGTSPARGVPNHLEVSPRTVGASRFPHGTLRRRRPRAITPRGTTR
jgi:hypothetical protein